MNTINRDVVAALSAAIALRIGESRFQFWFEPNTKFTWDDSILVVGVPNHFFQEWLQKTFSEQVRAAASEVLAKPMTVRFTIDPELFQAARRNQKESKEASPARTKTLPPAGQEYPSSHKKADSSLGKSSVNESETARRPARPICNRRWHRLEDFVVGPCNRLAHASALSIIESPGEGPNPLVLHGPVSTGKTHLLEGLYAGLRKRHPGWRVCFVTSEEFTNRFVQAMHLGKLGAFRKHFRECDALLVDDLHFLASKRATQEEFLHTFNALQTDGRQVVLSCDCHPRLAGDFTLELTDRLLGGAVWSLAPPDAETRLEILRAKAAKESMAIPAEVLAHLADKLRGNVRELEGALHSLRHFSQVAGLPVDMSLAQKALGDLLRHSLSLFQLPDIDRALCRALGLENGVLQSRQRSWAVSHPRMVAMYLARKYTTAAYSEIGRYFGGRNHSTAVAAEKKVRQWFQGKGELILRDRRLPVREVIELVEGELLR